MGGAQSAARKAERERLNKMREAEGRLFQNLSLSSLTATERRFIDNQSTTLHRAAAHGDPTVLRTVLQEKGAAAIWTLDGSRRTALHVAAYCGNYEAFQTFVAKDKSVDLLMRRDNTNRTAFEVLSQSGKGSRLYSNNIAYELCEETETQRNIHRFAAAHFYACHLWFLYVPNVVLLVLCAILSFVSATTRRDKGEGEGGGGDDDEEGEQNQLSQGVITLAIICVLLQTTAGVLRLDARAAAHDSCAKDLKELCKELNYTAVEEYVHDVEGQGEMPNAALIKKKLMQATAACKSRPPAALVELFNSLRTRVDHELCRVLRYDKNNPATRDNYYLLKDIAYKRAQISVTESLGWPFLMPWPKYAVKKILRKVAMASVDADGDGDIDNPFAADTDSESESDAEKDESDDEYDDEKRCLHQCFKKKKKKNDRKAAGGKSKKAGGSAAASSGGGKAKSKGSAGSSSPGKKMRPPARGGR